MLRVSTTMVSVCLLLALNANAQAAETATAQDEIDIQSCLEGVRDYNASNPDDDPESRDPCVGTVASACREEPAGQTTVGMVECYARETAVWDGLLNSHYAALEEELDPAPFAALRDTQRKWIAYRDAKCGLPYHFFDGGSIARPIGADCMNHETARRANELADYLDWMQN